MKERRRNAYERIRHEVRLESKSSLCRAKEYRQWVRQRAHKEPMRVHCRVYVQPVHQGHREEISELYDQLSVR